MKYKLLKDWYPYDVGEEFQYMEKLDCFYPPDWKPGDMPEITYSTVFIKSNPDWFAPVEERGAAEIIKKKSPFEVIKSHVAPIAKYSDEWTEGVLKALYLNGYEIVEKNIPAPDDDDDGIPPVIRTEKRTPITLNITSVRQGEPLLPDPEEDEIFNPMIEIKPKPSEVEELAKILKEKWMEGSTEENGYIMESDFILSNYASFDKIEEAIRKLSKLLVSVLDKDKFVENFMKNLKREISLV